MSSDVVERVFTTAELAARWRVTRQTITAAIRSGRLPAFRAGPRLYRVREEDVIRYEQHNLKAEVA